MLIVGETLGIIFPTCPTFCKESLAIIFQPFQLSAKNRQDIQPSTRPRINISQVPAGRFLFFRFSVFLRVFLCCLFVCVFFDCKCKSLKKTRRKQKNKHKETENTQNNSKKNRKQQKYRISSPRTSANKSHKLFAEVRGLDILYFCLFYVFL